MRRFGFIVLIILTAACTNRDINPIVPEALTSGRLYTVFAATSRQREPDGSFGFHRSERLRLLELTVSIPPDHRPGELSIGYGNPDPSRYFTLAKQVEFEQPSDFTAGLRARMAALPTDAREVTVFVHGYNYTQTETTFRAAQLATDIGLPGAMVIYSWPSRGKPLGYAYDTDSMLFARDGLEKLLSQIRDTGARRIILVAHSLGSALVMETLRQMDLKTPGLAARTVGGVILISPDLDIDLFRTQIGRLTKVPEPFVVFVSQRDSILNLSALLRGTGGTARLGDIATLDRVRDLPISVVDTTEFTDDAGSAHFVPGTSPALLAMLGQARQMNQTFRPEDLSLGAVLSGGVLANGGAVRITVSRNQGSSR